MQITLNQEEILEALDGYVRERIAIAENQEVTIDMKAGRSENGFTATLNIIPRVGATSAGPTVASHINARVQEELKQEQAASAAPVAVAQKNPFAKIAEEAPVAKATPFPNRRGKVEAETTAAVIQTTTAADPEPEVAESVYADVVDVVDPDEDNAVADPIEAEPEVTPVKRSIFSKAG